MAALLLARGVVGSLVSAIAVPALVKNRLFVFHSYQSGELPGLLQPVLSVMRSSGAFANLHEILKDYRAELRVVDLWVELESKAI